MWVMMLLTLILCVGHFLFCPNCSEHLLVLTLTPLNNKLTTTMALSVRDRT